MTDRWWEIANKIISDAVYCPPESRDQELVLKIVGLARRAFREGMEEGIMKKKKTNLKDLERKKRLLNGEGVEDLKNKHHCHCMFERLHAGEEGKLFNGGIRWKKIIIQDPGTCYQCNSTGWCY